MNDWFRSWHGAPTDPKWLSVGKKAGVAPGMVAAVVWALMDRASQSEERGSIEGFDAETIGDFFGLESTQVDRIVAVLHEKQVLENNFFSAWAKRQPKRENDNSSDRVRAHREQKKHLKQGNTETQDVTHCNAVKRTETLDTDTDTDTDTEAVTSVTASAAAEIEPAVAASPSKPPRFIEVGQKITDAMGLTNDPRWMGNWSIVQLWINSGYDPELDILPVCLGIVERKKAVGDAMPKTLKYFSNAIGESHRNRTTNGDNAQAPPSAGVSLISIKRGSPEYEAWIEHYRKRSKRKTFHETRDIITVESLWPPEAARILGRTQ
jgi:hypothetical protein